MKLPLRFLGGATCASCILILPRIVYGQTCYYPNGDISTSDYPCSSDVDGLCCPLNWQCLSNGLCYLENEQYYGRYTCTDRTWSATGCPEICTDGWHFQHRVAGIHSIYTLTSLQEILMPETRPSSNVQIMVETGVAIIIGTHLMSVATTPMTSLHCQRELLWHR